MANQLPHDYVTCNCPGCRAIKLDIKYHGRTSRPIPSGQWPPRPPKPEEAEPAPPAESDSTPPPPPPKRPAHKKK